MNDIFFFFFTLNFLVTVMRVSQMKTFNLYVIYWNKNITELYYFSPVSVTNDASPPMLTKHMHSLIQQIFWSSAQLLMCHQLHLFFWPESFSAHYLSESPKESLSVRSGKNDFNFCIGVVLGQALQCCNKMEHCSTIYLEEVGLFTSII